MKDYGYKLCYKKQNNNKWKIHIVTNTYDLAEWNRQRYELRSPPNTIWIVLPIQTRKEYMQHWKDCPF